MSASTIINFLILLQIPAGIMILIDSKKSDVKNAVAYFCGALIPAVGMIVIVAYISKRSELPKE